MIKPQQLPYPQPQTVQVEPAGFLAATMGALTAVLFAIWVVQQGIKVFRGEEIEKPL